MSTSPTRIVPAVHGHRPVEPDPPFEIGLADFLRARYSREAVLALMTRHGSTDEDLELVLRRAAGRAARGRFGARRPQRRPQRNPPPATIE